MLQGINQYAEGSRHDASEPSAGPCASPWRVRRRGRRDARRLAMG